MSLCGHFVIGEWVVSHFFQKNEENPIRDGGHLRNGRFSHKSRWRSKWPPKFYNYLLTY